MAPRISDEAKEEKRLALLEAALECFAQKGYYATSVDDIVSYSNLSKGSVYNYFKSKEEMFISLLQYQTKNSLEQIRQRLEEIASPTEQLKFMINFDIPYNLRKKKLMRVHLEFWMYSTESSEVKRLLTDRFDMVIGSVKEVIDRGQRAGEFKQNIDVTQAASMFWALHDGIWLHGLVRYGEAEVESRIREMERVMLAYLTT